MNVNGHVPDDCADIVVTLVSMLREAFGGSPQGTVIVQFIPAAKAIEIAGTYEYESMLVHDHLLSSKNFNYITLCLNLREKMYSPKTGAWMSFVIAMSANRMFKEFYEYDKYPESVAKNSNLVISPAEILKDLEEYPRRDMPEWVPDLRKELDSK